MKRELLVRAVRGVFCMTTSRDVADDCDATRNLALVVDNRDVPALKNPGRRWSIVVLFGNRLRSGKGGR